jgi:ABC-type multidrug transport system fused ATPase/permease subunit
MESGTGSDGLAQLTPWIAAILAVVLLDVVMRNVSTVVTQSVGHQISQNLSRLDHPHSNRMDLAFYEDSSRQDTLHRAQSEVGTRPLMILMDATGMIRMALTMIGLLVVLAAFRWWTIPQWSSSTCQTDEPKGASCLASDWGAGQIPSFRKQPRR